MKVILLKNVSKVGNKNEIKEVASGFALNYLIPQKLARTSTAALEREALKKSKEQEKYDEENEAKLNEQLNNIQGKEVIIKAKINEKGHLFARINSEEISNAIKDQEDVLVDPKYIKTKSIKEAGTHLVTIQVGKREININLVITAQ